MIGRDFVRDSLRPLLRRKGIAAIVIVTLALGVGVNAGIFSIFHQILLQELEVPDPGQVVVLDSPGPRDGSVTTDGTGRDRQIFSYPLYLDLRSASDTLAGMAAFRSIGINMGARGQTTSGRGLLVSGNYFEVLDLRPVAGRFFTRHELDGTAAPRVTVLSYSLWQNRFAGDPSMIGESIMVNGQSLEIIGVAPPKFGGLNRFWPADTFLPLTLVDDLTLRGEWTLEDRRSHWLYLFGRLAEGVSIAGARASLAPIFGNLIREVEAPLQQGRSETWMQRFMARELQLLPGAQGQSNTLESVRTPLILLLCVAALVLLVACVNITNLLLALGASERGETAVRQALGAGRRHIIGQRVAALSVLALGGTLVSLPVALATLRLVVYLLPASDAGILSAALDWRIMAVGLAVSIAALVIAGTAPILQALNSRPIEAMRDQVARSGLSRAAARFRSVLVAGQIALALALLVVSGLFIQSLANVNSVDLGLEPESVL
ncbi:MAG: ABC transporter permease, partial [Wenzhouxiangellaceae bacterium]